MQITQNFRLDEFKCKCGRCTMPESVKQNIIRLVTEVLQPLRDQIGQPIFVASGYRCKDHNRAVGGVPNSQHMLGKAADIVVRNTPASRMYKIVDRFMLTHEPPGPGGVGKYPGFTHVDIREARPGSGGSRW